MGMAENIIAHARRTIKGIHFDWQRGDMTSKVSASQTILSIKRIAWMENHDSVSKEDLIKCLRWMCDNTCLNNERFSGNKAFLKMDEIIQALQEKAGEKPLSEIIRDSGLIYDFDTRVIKLWVDNHGDNAGGKNNG